MFRRNICLVIALISSSSSFVSPSAEISLKILPSFECLAAYAKLKGVKDPIFEGVDYDSTNADCVMKRQSLISRVRTEIRSKINEAEILPKYSNCIYEKLTGSESFINSIIKSASYEHLEKTKEKSPLNETIMSMLSRIKSSVEMCTQEDEFGTEFDKLFNSATDKNKKLMEHEKYCIKKYLIKNSLIDSDIYDIDPNPHKINVTKLNCEEMIRKSNEEIYDQLGFIYLQKSNLENDEKVECAIEKFRDADYFDLMMKITALATLNITLEQKNRERENFIKIFAKISSNIAKC
jgi:hypothetical protein